MAIKFGASVIIPFYGDLNGLKTTLTAVRTQTWPRSDCEVLVINNGRASDVEPLRSEFPECHWLHEPQMGSYAARNRGLAHACGEIIAFTDSDCIPDPDWLEKGIKALKSSDSTIIGGQVLYIDPNDRSLNIYEKIEEECFLLGKQKYLIDKFNVAATANLFTYKATFDRVGRFNPELRSFGDGDWTSRAVARGEKLKFAADAIVRHPRRSGFLAIRKKWLRVAGGRILRLKSQNASVKSYINALKMDSWIDPQLHRTCLSVKGLNCGQRICFSVVLELLSLLVTAEKIRVMLGATPRRE